MGHLRGAQRVLGLQGDSDGIRGSNGLEPRQHMPQGVRQMCGDRASFVSRSSGNDQTSAIKAVGEEEEAGGEREATQSEWSSAVTCWRDCERGKSTVGTTQKPIYSSSNPRRATTERTLHKTKGFARGQWLCLRHLADCVSVAERDELRKHISTGEEAILVAVGDQHARIPPDRSGDGKRLRQACVLCWDSPPRAPSRSEERCRG